MNEKKPLTLADLVVPTSPTRLIVVVPGTSNGDAPEYALVLVTPDTLAMVQAGQAAIDVLYPRPAQVKYYLADRPVTMLRFNDCDEDAAFVLSAYLDSCLATSQYREEGDGLGAPAYVDERLVDVLNGEVLQTAIMRTDGDAALVDDGETMFTCVPRHGYARYNTGDIPHKMLGL